MRDLFGIALALVIGTILTLSLLIGGLVLAGVGMAGTSIVLFANKYKTKYKILQKII